MLINTSESSDVMIEKIRGKGCNIYVIELNDRKYVVDTGLPGNEGIISRAVKDCSGIILTHSHFDHMGSAYSLSKLLKCSVYSHPEEFDFLKGLKKHEYRGFLGTLAKIYERIKKPKYLEEIKSVEELEDLEIIHLPGHTPGSIAILFESSLICGDLVRGGGLFSKEPGLSSNNFNWNSEEYKKSLKKVLKLEFDQLLPGHGKNISRDEFENLVKRL